MPTTPLRELMAAKEMGATIPVVSETFETVSQRSSMDVMDTEFGHGLDYDHAEMVTKGLQEVFASQQQPMGIMPTCNAGHVMPGAMHTATSGGW